MVESMSPKSFFGGLELLGHQAFWNMTKCFILLLLPVLTGGTAHCPDYSGVFLPQIENNSFSLQFLC